MMDFNKKLIFVIIISVLIVGGGYLGYRYYLKKISPPVFTEKQLGDEIEPSPEDILRGLTASEEKKEFSEEDQRILKNLNAPSKPEIPTITDEEMGQSVLDSLTAPE